MTMYANQFAHRYYGTCREELKPVSNAPTITWSPQLVFAPGYFKYNDLTYDLTNSGLYRFCNPGINTTHMIVYGSDVRGLLASLAWITTFGVSDCQRVGETEAKFLDRVSSQVRTSKLRMLCENTCVFAKKAILDPLGINSRLVHFLTMENPTNSVDGHVCLEVNGGLIDLHNNVGFKDWDGKPLSAADTPNALKTQSITRDWLSSEGAAVEVFSNGQFDATGYADAYLLGRSDIALWQQRIFQAVGITAHNGEIWWLLPDGCDSRKPWVEGLASNYKVKDKAMWMGEFYP